MNAGLAIAMASMHASLIAFLIVGAPLSRRLPRVTRAHVVAVVATGAVFLAGADCPLTVWENHFRDAAGWSTYDSGFVAQYVIGPLTGSEAIGPWTQLLIVAAWVVPTALGYGVQRTDGSFGSVDRRVTVDRCAQTRCVCISP